SQLGYMFVAAGVGFYQAAMFHLFTHAAFKAMLFLGAGSVIHAMHHEQDLRNYGGLKDKLPTTFWAMMIGTLAITGVGIPFSYDMFGVPIGLAGFVSKDAVIEGAFAGEAYFAFWALVVAALFTSFYSWRLMFMTFYGAPRGDAHTHDHAHESPRVMTIPLVVLMVGAIFAGTLFYKPFVGSGSEAFFGPSIAIGAPGEVEQAATDGPYKRAAKEGGDHHDSDAVLYNYHYVPTWVKLSPFIAMLLGLGTAYMMYIRHPDWPAKLAQNQRPLYLFLLNKWYFDEIYNVVFVKPAMWVGRFLWKQGDGATIDGGINGLAMGIIPFFTRLAGRAQSGYVFHYAFAMILGIGAIVTWFVITGGAG
ncbi:MAG: proton-conducting transporter membrane subunit, partial [Pseudomonadota bacterium]